MSTSVFPTLPLLAWPVQRTSEWHSRLQESISGKETAIADWTYPRYHWELTYASDGALRQGIVNGSNYSEFAALLGFFNLRYGRVDPFLYQDADDHAVVGQGLGSGDGTTTTFQLVRAFGGFVCPIWAPNLAATLNVYLNGVLQSGSSYSVSAWNGTTSGGSGVLTFDTAPGAGVAVSADFSYYWPCRFEVDKLDFQKFMAALWSAKSVKFYSVK